MRCLSEFGNSDESKLAARELQKRLLRAVIYGAAVGDALGVPFESMSRDTFQCEDMVGGGIHGMPAGTFSDDTSLLLATCDSLGDLGCFCRNDLPDMFVRWLHEGAYTVDGIPFGVGKTTATAIDRGRGCDDERSNGNGSLMRIAPLAFIDATDDDIREASAVTHAHTISKEACVAFVRILREVAHGGGLIDAIERNAPADPHFAFMGELAEWDRDDVRSSGYVLDTLGAALWCAISTDNFKDCVLTAVNLGDDSDTTACVAGALAGALYGFEGIPAEWIGALRGKDLIDHCLANMEGVF